jgi:hypothetical protein
MFGSRRVARRTSRWRAAAANPLNRSRAFAQSAHLLQSYRIPDLGSHLAALTGPAGFARGFDIHRLASQATPDYGPARTAVRAGS